MASEDITKLAESLAKTKVGGGQLSFKGQSLKLNTAEDGKRKYPCVSKCLPEILKSCGKPPANPAWPSCHNISCDGRVFHLQLFLIETLPSLLVPCFDLLCWQCYSWQNWDLGLWCVILVFLLFFPSPFGSHCVLEVSAPFKKSKQVHDSTWNK